MTVKDFDVKRNWIIGICGSDMERIDIERVSGTRRQVMKYMADIAKDEIDYAKEHGAYEFGVESASEVEVTNEGGLYAYVDCTDSHLDIEAHIEGELIEL